MKNIVLIYLILLFSLEMNNCKKETYTIVATYTGGCGFSQMTKRNIIKQFVEYSNQANESCSFKSEINNLQIENDKSHLNDYPTAQDNDSTTINNYEFNIYFVKDGVKHLIYTSDQFNKNHYVQCNIPNEELYPILRQKINSLLF